jgi:hypothetical protein
VLQEEMAVVCEEKDLATTELAHHKTELARLQSATSDAVLAFGTRTSIVHGELSDDVAEARADAMAARKQLEEAVAKADETQKLLHEKDLQIQELIQ